MQGTFVMNISRSQKNLYTYQVHIKTKLKIKKSEKATAEMFPGKM
jgi:hypothetical protein